MQESERHEAGERADAARSKPTKRAKVMRGIVAPVFGLLAVTFFALGLLNATLWKPNASVTATGYLTSRYAVTDPGMLSLLDGTVNLQVGLDKATADGAGRSAGSDEGSKVSQEQPGKVCVAIGLAKDVSGWLAGSKYERIVGLHDHTQLHTQMMQGTAERDATKSTDSDSAKKADADKNAVDFEDSDMWSQVACAKAGRPVTMKVEAKDSQVALIDFGKAVPDRVGEVNMRWVRSRVPNTALPYYIAAALLVIATVLSASVFAMTPKPRKKPVKAQGEAGDASPGEVTITEALTGSLQGLRRGLHTSGPGRHSKKTAQEVAQEALVTEEGLRSARELQEQGPSIVDPSLHNLVRQAGGDGGRKRIRYGRWHHCHRRRSFRGRRGYRAYFSHCGRCFAGLFRETFPGGKPNGSGSRGSGRGADAYRARAITDSVRLGRWSGPPKHRRIRSQSGLW
ncbi:hypothetical protein [Bifidobacterium bombi]|uniref:Uncharacterized protein n=1 Tax=Bifidobacterium bombi DSM 19703 TaxID=1341695 RepID=A0A086BNR3_9BIFI|nr:hypothetical protein [Bifidobacterium bombi]KFF30577.1 hypothetical protein BBOMB_1438 [Bifidobacterium bombi DSM 19703]